MTGGAVLAVNNFGDTRSGGLAGPMALLIILLLAVATVLLIRNMNARLRRLPERFPGEAGAGPAGGRPERRQPDGAGPDDARHDGAGQPGADPDRTGAA